MPERSCVLGTLTDAGEDTSTSSPHSTHLSCPGPTAHEGFGLQQQKCTFLRQRVITVKPLNDQTHMASALGLAEENAIKPPEGQAGVPSVYLAGALAPDCGESRAAVLCYITALQTTQRPFRASQ